MSTDMKLMLSSEPGWGIAFIHNNIAIVYQKSLFWLLLNGWDLSIKDVDLNYRLGSLYFSKPIDKECLIKFLDLLNIKYFIEDDIIRWLVGHEMSDSHTYYYRRLLNKKIEVTNIQ